MPAGPSQGHGDLNPITAPAHFPSSFTSLEKKTAPSLMVYNSTNSTGDNVFTADLNVGQCEGFTVYVSGSGTWNVQAAPFLNDNESFWTDVTTDQSGGGIYSTVSFHPHMRVRIANGADLIVWVYRKFATY
jgi:hypothetical protein